MYFAIKQRNKTPETFLTFAFSLAMICEMTDTETPST